MKRSRLVQSNKGALRRGSRFDYVKQSAIAPSGNRGIGSATQVLAKAASLKKTKRYNLEKQALDMVAHAKRIEKSIDKATNAHQKAQREKLLAVHKSRLFAVLDALERMGRDISE